MKSVRLRLYVLIGLGVLVMNYISQFLTGTSYPLFWLGVFAVAGIEGYIVYLRRMETTTLCRLCRERVALDASVCPHCRSEHPVALPSGGAA